MFERYTERARRALFFARWEVSQRGAAALGTEHLLLGVLRDAKGLVGRLVLPEHIDAIQIDLDERSPRKAPVPTDIELPFADEMQRVFQFAAEEADALGHSYIGTEHLLLGLLREESALSSELLRKNGFDLAGVRTQIVALLQAQSGAGGAAHADIVEEIERLKSVAERLARKVPDQAIARPLLEQIVFGLDRLQERCRP
jgi:ATP-dependent Clp protease ATP-binding subunit ClpC